MTRPPTHEKKKCFKWAWRICVVIWLQGTKPTPPLGMCRQRRTGLHHHSSFPSRLHGTEKRDPGTFLLGADFLLSPPAAGSCTERKGNLLSPYFLTHVSDVQGCDCKQCHQPCQSCLLLPRSVPSTPGVPVIGRKANKAKQ